MNRLFMLIFLSISFNNAYSQAFDPKIIKELPDSGRIENGLKEGQWVEYSIDSVVLQGMSLNLGNKKSKMDNTYFLKKDVGNYLKGERTGIWIQYETYTPKPPLHYEKRDVRTYLNGKKEGEEINYQGYGTSQTPLMIRHWKDGTENGIGKIFDRNYPFKIKQQYTMVDGNRVRTQSFYKSDKLESDMADTIIKGTKLSFVKHYRENGTMDYSGYYDKGKKTGDWITYYENGKTESVKNMNEGVYKYFYENGQLNTEKLYKGDKLMKVVSNYTAKGVKNNPGTINNGTGTVNNYDPDGKFISTVEYVNGVEKKK